MLRCASKTWPSRLSAPKECLGVASMANAAGSVVAVTARSNLATHASKEPKLMALQRDRTGLAILASHVGSEQPSQVSCAFTIRDSSSAPAGGCSQPLPSG